MSQPPQYVPTPDAHGQPHQPYYPQGGGAPPQVYGQYGAPPPPQAYGQPTYQQQQHQQPHQQQPPKPHVAGPSHGVGSGGYGDGDGGERFPEQPAYRDLAWGVVFYVHLLVLLVAGFALLDKNWDGITSDDDDDEDGGSDEDESEVAQISVNGKFFTLVFLLFLFGGMMAYGWLAVMRKYAQSLIRFTLILSCVWMGLLTIFFFASGIIFAGIIFALFTALSVWYYYAVQRRIPFATVVLQMSVDVIEAFPRLVRYSVTAMFAQGLWFVVWVMCAASILYELKQANAPNGQRGFVYFLLLVSFFWCSQVAKNVVHVTSAGTMASWYFLAPHNLPQDTVGASFKRATTTSFGSICLGSLIIAVVKAVRVLAQQARNNRNDFVRACALCLIRCLERLVEYFNLYAFTYVAVYGTTYVEGAKRTWELLKRRGIDVIVNDDLIGGVLIFGALMSGAAGALFGGLGAHVVFDMPYWGFWALIGFIIFFVMSICVMEVVESCIAALFVCYADDPAALNATKPGAYATLTNAIQQFYGGSTRLMNA